jgi:hypothetical protein
MRALFFRQTRSWLPVDHTMSSRFVVLFHQLPASDPRSSHWDLMLENEGQLETWALDQLPAPGTTAAAVRLPAHRIAYLNYQGPIANDRGSVSQVMAGNWLANMPFDFGNLPDEFQLNLASESWRVTACFKQLATDRWQIGFD